MTPFLHCSIHTYAHTSVTSSVEIKRECLQRWWDMSRDQIRTSDTAPIQRSLFRTQLKKKNGATWPNDVCRNDAASTLNQSWLLPETHRRKLHVAILTARDSECLCARAGVVSTKGKPVFNRCHRNSKLIPFHQRKTIVRLCNCSHFSKNWSRLYLHCPRIQQINQRDLFPLMNTSVQVC